MIAESSRGTEARWTDGTAGCPGGVRARAERPNQLDVPSNGQARLHRSYAWGLDASGTLTGAGGVGGLLLTSHHTPQAGGGTQVTTLAPLYDFNGNVLAYADVATSTITHRMEYDPFGQELSLDTLLPGEGAAEAPRFRFSTKYTDGETGLVYYGYRYYSPELGRWVNRDPIEERGGINLYGMVGNDAVNKWDYLGLMVAASYDISAQKFKATDGGKSLSCAEQECSCGDNKKNNTDKQNGPLPPGTYRIYRRVGGMVGGNAAFILDQNDEQIGDDYTSNGRYGFRIHLWVENDPSGKKGSNGCIVMNIDCLTEFDKMLSATTPGPKKQILSPKEENGSVVRDGNGNIVFESMGELEQLGTLTVTR